MIRLLVHVEGQAEETFVNDLLRGHLMRFGFIGVSARVVGNPRLRGRRRGSHRWEDVRTEILRHLKMDSSAVAALMVDYCALAQDWPGQAGASNEKSTSAKADFVESALLDDIGAAAGMRFDPRRFVPLVMMHEFEGVLFSDPDRLAKGIARGDLAQEFRAIRQEFDGPEDINGSAEMGGSAETGGSAEASPSRRIVRLFPQYERQLFGSLAAMEIGLVTMRQECPHFNKWLKRVESLPGKFAYPR